MTAPVFDTATTINRLGNKLIPVFTGKLLPVLVLTVIMVLYSRKLSYADYGQFQTIWIYSNIISVIISFGISSVILSTGFDYFTSYLKSNRLQLLLLYAVGAMTAFAVFYFTTHNLTARTKLLLTAFILLQCACTLTDTLLIKNNLLKIYVWINIIYTLLFFAVHLYFCYHVFALDQLICWITVVSVIKATAIFFIRAKNTRVTNLKAPAGFVTNWIFIGLNEITGVVARWLDKIFLLYLLAPAQFAIFFNGAFEIPLFGILISAMENIMLTNISADLSNKTAAQHIFKESFKILSIIAFPLFFFLLTMHAEAFAVLFNNKYNASIPVFLVSIFIIPVRITHYGVLLQCYGQSKKIAFGSLMDIAVSLVLMFILYPLTGTVGVALAIVLSTYLQAIYYLWQSVRITGNGIASLVPGYFLLRSALALAAIYGLLYLVKNYFGNITSLITMFVITGIIIIVRLAFYWNRYVKK